MKNEEIIEAIVDKINAGYDDYGIEKFLEHQEINAEEYNALIKAAKNKILEHKLHTYPKQNRDVFIISIALFVFFFLFCLILPLLNIGGGMIPLSILAVIGTSLSGYYALLYYKSWKKDFIERMGKPKLDLETYVILFTLPTILFHYIIFGSFLEGTDHNPNNLSITAKFIKSLFP
ncbi:MAG TPA: hypothetical protein VIV55_00420 [Flavobacterium sp.]